MTEDKWLQKKNEIDNTARWLQEGERVEIVYGEFEEVETPRKDRRSGREYISKDFKIAVVLPDGRKAFRKVGQYLFSEIIGQFQREKMPKTIQYMRPYYRGR